ncbi:Glutathione s-transferase omega-like [Thalictrum thalictroides]|uniref:Glutathione s-transferase omega-like n=1 Tax=Thalictrum thalictroides TaxID=46969 RepID=A0A7J6VUM7_THATH|nr:Glutathione s-transferase omega-like [Thalictrum thalictroides]
MSLQPQQPPNQDLLTSITKLLWGKSLPPQLLISTVRTTWNATWHLMMKQLAPSDPSGSYTRPISKFRANLKSYSISSLNPGTLHLYVGLPCPWAHRTLIVRALKGLEETIPVSIASPSLDGSWEFRQTYGGQDNGVYLPGLDKGNGRKILKEVYGLHRGGYDGRSTVPMLWDTEKKEVLCNESYDIIEFFNGLNSNDSNLDLAPPSLKGKIDEWNQTIYPNVNNGVYRCGFAQSQEAYDTAVNGLFTTLDMIDDHLATSRYLCGDMLTLADVCLFTTLIRFDLVYNVLFKCTKKKLLEYSNLNEYMRDIYQIPKVSATCNFEAIMEGYYKILFPLNPGSIQPAMPSVCDNKFLLEPHNRETLLSSLDKRVEASVS